MTTEELIDRYGIKDGATMGKPGALFISRQQQVKRDNMLDEIKSRKPEILAHFAAKREGAKQAAQAREAKIKSIEGLDIIQSAIADITAWRTEFSASFDDVGGLGVRPSPNYDIKSMLERYPHAAAYLRAKEYADKSNYELSGIGKNALDRVIDGDWEAAMVQMDKDLEAYTDRHLWD